MRICMHYFASLREIIGASEEALSIPEATSVAGIRTLLLERYPRLEHALARAICAVNRQYVSAETVLRENDEVAFIPPVGGGRPQHLRKVVC